MKAYETEFRLFVNYGQRWEHETTESSYREIVQRVKEYRENAPGNPVKWSRARVVTDEARDHAREVLRACGIERGADFHALPAATVEALIAYADRDKYRKPRDANGSRGRYYHARIQRLARDPQ